MELNLSKEDAAFRDEVRTFIAENYPTEMRVPNPETDLTKEQSLLWHRILYRKGWIAPLWPKEYGGPGWTITQRYIFEQETSRVYHHRPGIELAAGEYQCGNCHGILACQKHAISRPYLQARQIRGGRGDGAPELPIVPAATGFDQSRMGRPIGNMRRDDLANPIRKDIAR